MNRIESQVFVKPTTYKNVLMRSRTEARAAQWFEGFGWNWVYEPEAFITGKGQYTPDFYIPEIDALVEVKPMFYMSETIRILSFVEQIGKTFFIIYPCESTFLVHDLYGRVDGCDPSGSGKLGNSHFGWASHYSERSISIDNCRGHFPCHMVYMGSGCGNRNYCGDCCCTR